MTPHQGELYRDEAIARVERHAAPDWKAEAWDAVQVVAARAEEFTTDEVWAELAQRRNGASTHEPRAMGAIMRNAEAAGLIEPTERWRLSDRAACHRRPMRVWRRKASVPW